MPRRWWNRPDSNRQPPDPKSGALTILRHCSVNPLIPIVLEGQGGLEPHFAIRILRNDPFGYADAHAIGPTHIPGSRRGIPVFPGCHDYESR